MKALFKIEAAQAAGFFARSYSELSEGNGYYAAHPFFFEKPVAGLDRAGFFERGESFGWISNRGNLTEYFPRKGKVIFTGARCYLDQFAWLDSIAIESHEILESKTPWVDAYRVNHGVTQRDGRVFWRGRYYDAP